MSVCFARSCLSSWNQKKEKLPECIVLMTTIVFIYSFPSCENNQGGKKIDIAIFIVRSVFV